MNSIAAYLIAHLWEDFFVTNLHVNFGIRNLPHLRHRSRAVRARPHRDAALLGMPLLDVSQAPVPPHLISEIERSTESVTRGLRLRDTRKVPAMGPQIRLGAFEGSLAWRTDERVQLADSLTPRSDANLLPLYLNPSANESVVNTPFPAPTGPAPAYLTHSTPTWTPPSEFPNRLRQFAENFARNAHNGSSGSTPPATPRAFCRFRRGCGSHPETRCTMIFNPGTMATQTIYFKRSRRGTSKKALPHPRSAL